MKVGDELWIPKQRKEEVEEPQAKRQKVGPHPNQIGKTKGKAKGRGKGKGGGKGA